jgi:hypothetical protein
VAITVATAGVLGPAELGLVSASTATAIGGATAGATSAGIAGENPLLGAATGFVLAGGFGEGIIGGIGFSGSTPLTSLAASTANGFIRGAALGTFGSLIAGTSFSDALKNGLIGGAFASASNVAGLVYKDYVGYDADPSPGGEAVQKPAGVPVVKGTNNIGFANCSSFACEGQLLSRILSRIPGVNAVAGFHNTLTANMSGAVFRC